MKFTAIVAMTPARIIGKDGTLPWHLPDDLRLFKQKTMGHAMLMGRKTWDSIGRPLPGRQSLVLSRDPAFTLDTPPEAARVIRSLDELETVSLPHPEVMIIGGARIYELMLPHVTTLWVSRLKKECAGDTSFPPFEHLFAPPVLTESFADFELYRYDRA